MQQLGLASCELWQNHVEPRGIPRDELRRWRETVSLDEFRALKERFDRAKVQIAAYNISFRDDFSNAEIERGFEMTRALVGVILPSRLAAVTTSCIVAAMALRSTTSRMCCVYMSKR